MNKGRGFQRGWWLVLITIGVMYTASVPFFFIQPAEDSFLFAFCGELVLIIPVIVGMFMLFWEQLPQGVAGSVGFCGFPVKLLPFVILLPMAAQPFAGFLLLPVQGLLTFLFGGEDYSDLIQADSAEAFLQSFFLLCIAAPILEEIICRGVLMQLFRRYGTAVMLLYSSLGFALLHLSAQSLIPLFFLGVVLGVIRLTSGSIFASMIAHAACNLYSLTLLGAGALPMPVEWLIVVAGVALFPVLGWFYLKRCDALVDWKSAFTEKYSPVGFSVGFAIVCAVFLLVNVFLLISRFINGTLLYDMYQMMPN